MRRQRAPYANRSVWWVVAVLAIVLVVGFAIAGYEINHLRNEVDGLHTQIKSINGQLQLTYSELLKLGQQIK
jgi:hypothetical protein